MTRRTYVPVLALALASLPAWAAGVEAPGIRNFHQVNDHIYRGGQPTDEGWASLAKLGVKTVIDLRREDEHSTEAEARAVDAAGMRYVNVPLKGMATPSDADVAKVLAWFDSGSPVFVHCKEGKDRTGTVIACYRVAHDHWNNQRALDEAKSHGLHWFEIAMKSYIASYQPGTAVAGAGELQPATATP